MSRTIFDDGVTVTANVRVDYDWPVSTVEVYDPNAVLAAPEVIQDYFQLYLYQAGTGNRAMLEELRRLVAAGHFWRNPGNDKWEFFPPPTPRLDNFYAVSPPAYIGSMGVRVELFSEPFVPARRWRFV